MNGLEQQDVLRQGFDMVSAEFGPEGGRISTELGDVRLTRGATTEHLGSLVIDDGRRIVMLDEMPGGKLVAEVSELQIPAHDDERDLPYWTTRELAGEQEYALPRYVAEAVRKARAEQDSQQAA